MNRFIILLFCILISCSGTTLFAKIPAGLEKLRDVNTQDEDFNKTFREGRDLLEREDWQRAAGKFERLVCDCPDRREVDAAFYWLAFAYKKLGRIVEMNNAIARLRKNFPSSSWVDDAMILQIEARAPIAGFGSNGNVVTYKDGLAAMTLAETSFNSSPLDRQDEIRLAAFQSLWATDRTRALEVLAEQMKKGSRASVSLKRAMLRSVGRGTVYAFYPGDANVVSVGGTTSPSRKSDDPEPIRETLLKIFRSDLDPALRPDVISAIAAFGDKESIEFLARSYKSENDKDTRKAIIKSLSNSFGFSYSISGGGVAPVAIATTTVRGAGVQNSSASRDLSQNERFKTLLSIYRDESDPELKSLAFERLQSFAGWENVDGMFDEQLREYDSSQSEQRKLAIIASLGRIVSNQKAVRKLMDIARNDGSDKMRLAAIRALRASRSPEVAKFLEDLIN